MFGDSGHGTLMLVFALYLVLNEKKIAKMKGGEVSYSLSPLLFYDNYT